MKGSRRRLPTNYGLLCRNPDVNLEAYKIGPGNVQERLMSRPFDDPSSGQLATMHDVFDTLDTTRPKKGKKKVVSSSMKIIVLYAPTPSGFRLKSHAINE